MHHLWRHPADLRPAPLYSRERAAYAANTQRLSVSLAPELGNEDLGRVTAENLQKELAENGVRTITREIPYGELIKTICAIPYGQKASEAEGFVVISVLISPDLYENMASISEGYEEYQHALGHQVGRLAHDGGTLLAPHWERYGNTPNGIVEAGNVFTLELYVTTKDFGQVSLEEDVLGTKDGCRFISKPQKDLICV